MMLCVPSLREMLGEERITYRIATDGTGLFLLPYDCWQLPPYLGCPFIRYDEIEHRDLPLVERLITMRGFCGVEQ